MNDLRLVKELLVPTATVHEAEKRARDLEAARARSRQRQRKQLLIARQAIAARARK